jgi:hypothetical protein
MPVTFMVLIVIFESGMFGSTGAVASIMTIPVKPVHWARPFMSTLTPAGTGCAENGFPTDHRTGVAAIMGSMLKFPMAVNCTMPLEFLGSAEAGDTVMLCIWRADIIIMELPPQEIAIKRTAAIGRTNKALWVDDLWTNDPLMNVLRINALLIEHLRIDTSKLTAEKGKR